MELLNLHLTGDFHAVTAAHNLLAAMIDNHLHQGNELGLDLDNITWRRVLDVNDRALRNIVIGLGGKEDGVVRQTGFDITAASEVMAIFALATSMEDLRDRLGRIVVGYTKSGTPVTAEQLSGAGSMAVIMRTRSSPTCCRRSRTRPVIVHAGPFGNIAHGNSSVVGDLIGIHGGDYLITEAGFGADMGAERFFNIKCRASGLVPDAAVLVATVRALKAHSGKYKIVAGKPLPAELLAENPDDVLAGAANLAKQIENVKAHGVTPVVAINASPPTTPPSTRRSAASPSGGRTRRRVHPLRRRRRRCDRARPRGDRGVRGAERFHFLYNDTDPLKTKIEKVATTIYGAERVEYTAAASKQLKNYEDNGFGNLPVCIAKTHLSISGDASLKGAPTGHTLTVREARASVGAGFVYPICGEMRTMPGLGTKPAASIIDFDEDGQIVGLS
jgi:formate--tetrahydrofolate ligase